MIFKVCALNPIQIGIFVIFETFNASLESSWREGLVPADISTCYVVGKTLPLRHLSAFCTIFRGFFLRRKENQHSH